MASNNRQMKHVEPLRSFARGLHQDCMVGLSGLEELADELLANLSVAERAALREWLCEALQALTPAELKGLLNRASPSIGFSSNGAHQLLRITADRLRVP